MGPKSGKGLSKVEKIKIQKGRDKEEEISVLTKSLPQTSEKSVWSWLEEFRIEWSETFITKKKKKPQTP